MPWKSIVPVICDRAMIYFFKRHANLKRPIEVDNDVFLGSQ